MTTRELTNSELVAALRTTALDLQQKNGDKAEYVCGLMREAARRLMEKGKTL